MKVSLFLGAGASAMFGKPTTAEFLQLLPEKLNGNANTFYNHLADNIQFKDIEDVLQALKEVRLFVNTGVGRLAFTDTPVLGNHNVQSGFLQLSAELESRIESIIKLYYGWKHDHDQKLLDVYCQIFQDLRARTGALTVFTTNYDTAIETYCRMSKCTCVDGFDEEFGIRKWTGNFDAQNADNHVCLYKLHGSLEWKLHKEYGVIMGPELGNGPNIEKDVMIMPTRSPKDEEKEAPFSEIFGLMKKEFRRQDVCIVVGYSFRDESINDVFREFIRYDKTIIVVSPTVAEDVPNNLLKQECESASGSLGELYISPKEGLGRVIGFVAKFEPGNAAEVISKSLSLIHETPGGHPYHYRHD